MQKEIADTLAFKMLSGEIPIGKTVTIDAQDKGLKFIVKHK
jgi:ATP-dependent Clp protease ATP-binding subunit ClpA